MSFRSVEETVRAGRFGATLLLRVDLHGVSSFGPGKHRALIRWEWIETITAHNHGVVVTSDNAEVVFPAGVFGMEPAALAERLEKAGSIAQRADVLVELTGSAPDS